MGPGREAPAGDRPCARGDWCVRRTVSTGNGERVITPALTYRAYCDGCRDRIGFCLAELPGFYGRLEVAIGDPVQAEVQVHMPFGPQLPLREDIDALLRRMAATLGGWHERVATVARLAGVDTQRARRAGGARVVSEAVRVLGPHLDALLALEPGPMLRVLPAWAVPDDVVPLAGDGWDVTVIVDLGAEAAGADVFDLHHWSRSLLLETDPVPEPLVTPCRYCTRRMLYRAWPDDKRDLFSRCAWCKDEMSSVQYDLNAKRWLAYHKGRLKTPLLADAPTAA